MAMARVLLHNVVRFGEELFLSPEMQISSAEDQNASRVQHLKHIAEWVIVRNARPAGLRAYLRASVAPLCAPMTERGAGDPAMSAQGVLRVAEFGLVKRAYRIDVHADHLMTRVFGVRIVHEMPKYGFRENVVALAFDAAQTPMQLAQVRAREFGDVRADVGR